MGIKRVKEPVKILAIDDDKTLLRFIREHLEGEGFEVVTADRGPKALRLFYQERPDLVLLDIMMPGMDGWEVCARLREFANTPVILLTAKTAEADKLRGFRLGADDFVTKPFSLAELAARVRAVLARSAAQRADEASIHHIGPLVVDMRKRQVTLDHKLLSFTPTEFRLLAALVRRAGEAISREQLISEVWGNCSQVSGSALRRYIWFLRQKIETEPELPKRLITLRGYGYRLEEG